MMNIKKVSGRWQRSKAASHIGKVDDVWQVLQVVLHLVLNFFDLLELPGVFLEWTKMMQH